MMICVEDIFASEKVFEYYQDEDDLRLRYFAGEKIFEYFQDNDDLQLRQFCRRKSL